MMGMAMLKLAPTKGTHLKLAPTKVHPRTFRTFMGVGSWVPGSSGCCSWVPTSSWYGDGGSIRNMPGRSVKMCERVFRKKIKCREASRFFSIPPPWGFQME